MSPEGRDDEFERRTRRLRFRIAFFVTSLVALSVIVTLPFSVKSVVDDVLGPVTGRVVRISRDRPDVAHRNHTKLHMAMVAIDETHLLVLLIASAAAYSVFLRPLHDLVLNSGALVLGVWRIRSILTPQNLFSLTAVDLALSTVIIFTLGAMTVRALLYVHDEADLTLFRRVRR